MKLYIPTTTLNFNNILSSETISPKAFYGKRGYGYKRWENVAENCLENGILLYKEPFSFNRPSNGLDDYPMLIELEMDESEIAELEPCGDWGYKSNHSLMLTPVTARFIFFPPVFAARNARHARAIMFPRCAGRKLRNARRYWFSDENVSLAWR